MATLGSITELRTLPQLTRLEDFGVDADETICEITGSIQNNTVTLASVQAFFTSPGKLYLETASGQKHYLTDSETNYPANFQILSSYFIPRNESLALKYSATCTCTGLIVVASGGVF